MAANNRYPAWAPEETERLIKLYLADERWHTIAAALGRSKEACRSKARSLTLTEGQSKGYNQYLIDMQHIEEMLKLGYTRQMIGDELGIHRRTVHRHVQKYGSQKLKSLWARTARHNQLEGLKTPARRKQIAKIHRSQKVML